MGRADVGGQGVKGAGSGRMVMWPFYSTVCHVSFGNG